MKRNTLFFIVFLAFIFFLGCAYILLFDPLSFFAKKRDAIRSASATKILNAIQDDRVARGGLFAPDLYDMVVGKVYMIGTDTSNCDKYNAVCTIPVSGAEKCVNLVSLTTKMTAFKEVPIAVGRQEKWTSGHTGYTLQREATDRLIVRSCEHETVEEISFTK